MWYADNKERFSNSECSPAAARLVTWLCFLRTSLPPAVLCPALVTGETWKGSAVFARSASIIHMQRSTFTRKSCVGPTFYFFQGCINRGRWQGSSGGTKSDELSRVDGLWLSAFNFLNQHPDKWDTSNQSPTDPLTPVSPRKTAPCLLTVKFSNQEKSRNLCLC